jgi:hypothetical protein
MEKILLPVVQYGKIMYGLVHKFQTEQKLGKHDLPGNRSQKVAASHILYYYTKYIFNFMTRDHTLFFRIVQSEVINNNINCIMVVCFIGGGSRVPGETHRKLLYGKNTTSDCTIRKNNVWSRVIKLKI